jgi:hypothetical protein
VLGFICMWLSADNSVNFWERNCVVKAVMFTNWNSWSLQMRSTSRQHKEAISWDCLPAVEVI